MRVSFVFRWGLVAALVGLTVLPAIAGAVLSGANGRIVYISGRDRGQNETQVYLRVAGGSLAFGGNSGPYGLSAQQHRHPTWSPDRTTIAYAAGPANCAGVGCDIYTLDLTNPFAIPLKLTDTPNVVEDRPAWSPDGTQLAYESDGDILVDPFEDGELTLNLTNSAAIEGKPAWSPDSSEIYYHTGDPTAAGALDIVKEPANGGTVTNIATAAGINEFQPSLSPDGKQLCFTRGTGVPFGAGANTNDVIVSLANGGGQLDLSDDAVAANYNCTWSPTGQQVAYVSGAFTSGDLVQEPADDSGFALAIEATTGEFDGNPDWAPDGRPVCPDAVNAATTVGKAVTIELQCFDSGPFYERSLVRESRSLPGNGTVGDVQQGDQGPSTVVYTPNPGFVGTDSFKYNSFDEIAGFGEGNTVTIVVSAPGGGGGGGGAPKAGANPPPNVAPVISDFKVRPKTFETGTKLPKISAAKGATIRWRLSEAAATKLTFQRKAKGKRVNAGAINVANGKAGPNRVLFQGVLPSGKVLLPGSYRVTAQARDPEGLASKTLSVRFTIVNG